jgi:hypothetical protein
MSVTSYQYRYIPSKPVTFADLPGYRWVYIECPPSMAGNMGGCPTSEHEFGVIATDKFVLQSIRDKAGLVAL